MVEKLLKTTHAGSLPRPLELVRTMFAKEEGVPVDERALDGLIAGAVRDVVARQVAAGIDIVNDVEMSKPSYATYIKDRLEGFGGADNRFKYRDLDDFPAFGRRVFGDPGRSRRRTPTCNGPIGVKNAAAAQRDVANLRAAMQEHEVEHGFMSAASPGVVALFFANEYYATREHYLEAIANAMREEYECVINAGFDLQIDCPDLAMGRHIQFADATLADFRRQAALNVEALNHALRGLPVERLRMHICWGNYDGPHHFDVPLRDIADIIFSAHPSMISLEGANPRHAHEWAEFDVLKLPDGKKLIPGVLESKTNFIEHPRLIAQRLERYADRVGAENVLAGTDCGYGTWVGQAAVDPEIVFSKFQAMAEGAALARARYA